MERASRRRPTALSFEQPALPFVEEYVIATIAPEGLEVASERDLAAIAVALGGDRFGGPLSLAEGQLLEEASGLRVEPGLLSELREAIIGGKDALGRAFARVRNPVRRRAMGAFYTPTTIVEPMVAWVLDQRPDRVVDAGCGSGRFAAAAGRRSPHVAIMAIDLDPLATLMTRATLSTLGVRSARVLNVDFTTWRLPAIAGRTAFIGNPPYVRHHDLTQDAKVWAAQAARSLGVAISGLAGLHAHFFLAAALSSKAGDVGCFVTSSEWLDVRYGQAIRDLMLDGLGIAGLHVLCQQLAAFEDAQVTVAITCWRVGDKQKAVTVRRAESIAELRDLSVGDQIPRDDLARSSRWTRLLDSPAPREGMVRLGDLVRVHRGLVTGANHFFVLDQSTADRLDLSRWCIAAITDASEILESKGVIRNDPYRMLLLRVPRSTDRSEDPALDRYLSHGETEPAGKPVSSGYICMHRSPWWWLGAQEPPPIVASYMARQAPMFATNPDGLALLNIGHGLYPRAPMTRHQLQHLVATLNGSREAFRGHGRTYQGGLEKFEPSELEDLLIPMPF